MLTTPRCYGIGLLLFAVGCLATSLLAAESSPARPNIILCMSDDQGWGDVGYHQHPTLKTPHLDRMVAEGIRFERFYSGAPVCSPTRGCCLTGRHPYRYGIWTANAGHMKSEEVTLAELLREQGYTTGHFGKWHLGTLTTAMKDSNRGGRGGTAHFSPPWMNGFDSCFSTEAKVPTWNPMLVPAEGCGIRAGSKGKKPGDPFGTRYWTGPDEFATDNLDGDDSQIIMDRAIPFIEGAVKNNKPFFAVIWFHAPHLPAVGGGKYLEMYSGEEPDRRHYYACISAMDAQLCRLRHTLRRLGVDENTMLWFCSDNGPEGKDTSSPGRTAGLRGRKRSLYEGGVRVPGILIWPAQVKEPRTVTAPCVTADYFPTIVDALGLDASTMESRPYDGVSLLPLIDGTATTRPKPIAFESHKQVSLVDNRYKLYRGKDGKTFELYDLVADPGETTDLADAQPETVARMQAALAEWQASCSKSAAGGDYPPK